MGLLHFKMLLTEAREADSRAMPIAIEIFDYMKSRPLAAVVRTPWIWEGVSFDKLVQIMRGLRPLEEEFTARLQDLVARGRVTATLRTEEGSTRVLDPDYLVPEYLALSPPALYQYLLLYPTPVEGVL